ncbi:HesB/IscA family protein [Rickettsia endosymbiont of Cardiosporidium cionae]|uniref:HesB/IscA family protein n=1 Tax=Rickettsia endosymbiont of Cardiosporidium cionae TaxID=2777155 RepID=UPI0018955043|nr:iron-sulfur cluster assembly accessory protein [Rickettsia endosymbiont of Cardiosporidium cionae]KAF8818118.1 iron-sulfur cluster assembly accessory protein [Rickettsia endosymbiont of Cardiosporidium cionae]
MELFVTENAFKELLKLVNVSPDPKIGLRVSVSGGGCSGFMYEYKLITNTNQDDFIIQQDSVVVAVDPVSLKFLDGAKLDFIEELGSSYFSILNPSATDKCGCGNSFSI